MSNATLNQSGEWEPGEWVIIPMPQGSRERRLAAAELLLLEAARSTQHYDLRRRICEFLGGKQ